MKIQTQYMYSYFVNQDDMRFLKWERWIQSNLRERVKDITEYWWYFAHDNNDFDCRRRERKRKLQPDFSKFGIDTKRAEDIWNAMMKFRSGDWHKQKLKEAKAKAKVTQKLQQTAKVCTNVSYTGPLLIALWYSIFKRTGMLIPSTNKLQPSCRLHFFPIYWSHCESMLKNMLQV